MEKISKILVLGNTRQAITVIRSLAGTECDVIVGRSGDRQFTEFSRFVSEVWVHPPINESEEEFTDQLIRLLKERKNIYYIFPVDEEEIACLERHIDRLSSLTTLIMPEKNTFFTCLDKARMYEICSSLGIPIPGTKTVRSITELHENAAIIGYPVIIKPNDCGKFFWDNKAIIVNTPQDLAKIVSSWPTGNEFIVLQKYLSGNRHNGNFFAVNGEIQLYFEYKTTRTDRVSGTGVGVDTVAVKPTKLLQDYCSLLIKKMRFNGVGCVQFIVSNNGQVHFIEINPRLSANCALPYRCGADFPRLAFEAAKAPNNYRLQFPTGYRINKRAHWLMGDIYGLDNEIKRGNVNKAIFIKWTIKMLKTFLAADYHMTWWWRDPLPTLFLYYRLFAGIIRRIARAVSVVKEEKVWTKPPKY